MKKLNHFEQKEFKCKCGCGMDCKEILKEKIDLAREYSGVVFSLNSAARCKIHNKKVGGVEDSEHVNGLAVDIHFSSDLHLVRIIYGLAKAGFTRIGVNYEKKFVHADLSFTKPNYIWQY